jgi:rhomboid protease GluP
VFWIQRTAFAQPEAAENLVRALLQCIASRPEGPAQLTRMAEIEELIRSSRLPTASLAVALACIAVAALATARGPVLHAAGTFSTTLVAHGEVWRMVTANFLHASFPLHLFFNAVGLVGLGMLVERPLGAARACFVLGLSALGAMGAGLAVGYENLVGASGMVAGLAGAALWLELRRPERLPAFWRIPRRLFLGLLLADASLPLLLPAIAGTAHAGGFAAGFLAAALCTGPRLRRESAAPVLLGANALLAALASAALVSVAPLALGRADAWSQHAARLLRIPDVHPVYLNAGAWLIATASRPSRDELERALLLAERAVRATDLSDPNVLDTLAEVQFRSGRIDAALATIDRAIALAPDEPYFREQRRRFSGERAVDDMPPPPRLPPPRPAPPPRALPPDERGVRA